MRKLIVPLTVLGICLPALGQNLLVNPGFSQPPAGPGKPPCGPGSPYRDFTVPTGWTVAGNTFARYVGTNEENETELINLCPGGPNADGFYSIMLIANALTASSYIYQTVSVEPGASYRLSGVWGAASRGRADGRWVQLRTHLQLLDGDNNGALLKERTAVVGDRRSFPLFGWDDFTPLVVTPTTSQLTVKLWGEQLAPKTWSNLEAVYMDDLVLEAVDTCLLQPELAENSTAVVDSVTGDRTVPRASTRSLTISGANFTPGQMSVKLKKDGQADIPGTITADSATSMTADFVLPADMATGPWDVVVTGPDCPSAIANGALEVHLTDFVNGGFEEPVTTACTATRTPNFPAGWSAIDCGHWRHDGLWADLYGQGTGDMRQNFLNLNGFCMNGLLTWTPTCPAEGDNYATMARLLPGINTSRSAFAWQTFTVTPGLSYTVSGLFAWKGNSFVKLGLLDGDTGVRVGTTGTNYKTLVSGSATSNWKFGYYSTTASKPRMTAFFQSEQLDTTSTEVSFHADAMSVKPCVNNFSLGIINPAEGEAGMTIPVTISGSGFVSTPEPPVVILTGPSVVFGTNMQVSPGSISCTLDLSGAEVGQYSVVVTQGGCVNDSALSNAFEVTQSVSPRIDEIGPAYGVNDETVAVVLTGANLEGLAGVKLVRDVGGDEVVGTLDPPGGPAQTQRGAQFDLTGAEMGRYDVVPVVVGGSMALDRAFLVVAAAPSNLSFETGTSASDAPGGPCVDDTWNRSRPLDWDTVPADTAWFRDASTYFTQWVCPTDGDHMGSFTAFDNVTLKAFQTIRTSPGQNVAATANIYAKTASGSHLTRMILLDGDENGTEVMRTEIVSTAVWEPVGVNGLILGDKATLVFEIDGTTERAASYFDEMVVDLSGGCGSPLVDVDYDGDVDQEDFGIYQVCYGTLPEEPPVLCLCFDRAEPFGEINAADYLVFQNCASGPGLPADPDCTD
ncbi:MAG: hypothetical protein AMXMBFR13_07110 [Phycisphaerae bacterium]